MTEVMNHNPYVSPSDDFDELMFRSISEMRELFLAGEISPVEVTRTSLARIERYNEQLGAFVQVAPESAIAAAEASEMRYARGESSGPLDGVVISVKDIIAVEGLQWEAGSQVLKGNRATRDAASVAALRQAGCIIVGKTSLDEFALTTTGPAVNPLDQSLTAGGSSGGAAVAVRSGMSFFDLATDTGGSTRIPAYCCGTAGFKPTRSLLSLDNVLPLAHSLDHLGLITRSVADCEMIFGSLLPATTSGQREAVKASQIRIGVPTNLHFYDPGVESKYMQSVELLSSAGVRRVDVVLPDLDHVGDIHRTILLAEMREFHGRRYGRSEDRYGPGFREFLWDGPDITTEQYLEAQRRRGALTAVVSDALATCDLLLLPTMVVDTPRAGQIEVDLGGEPTFATSAMVRLTSLFNHTGHPALTLPACAGQYGALAGAQLVAEHHNDMLLLDIARLLGNDAVPTFSS
ncbi:amidase [Nocardia testacea]|uniref:amidase n=1 Tax=Nocardia testacea TaxID=248551 RepID=UPI0033F3EED1